MATSVVSPGTFPVGQWLRLHVPNAGDKNLILGQGTKISHAQPCRLKKIKLKKKEEEEEACPIPPCTGEEGD